jgi:hypothetical protein
MSLRRRGAGAHRYPPEARRQPRRGALPPGGRGRSSRRRATLCAPPWVGRWHVRQRRHQRAATAGTPLASPLADVPPRAALGAHLDHRTSLAPATMRAAEAASCGGTSRLRGRAGQSGTARRRCGPPKRPAVRACPNLSGHPHRVGAPPACGGVPPPACGGSGAIGHRPGVDVGPLSGRSAVGAPPGRRCEPVRSGQQQQLPMAIHSFHRFVHNCCVGIHASTQSVPAPWNRNCG